MEVKFLFGILQKLMFIPSVLTAVENQISDYDFHEIENIQNILETGVGSVECWRGDERRLVHNLLHPSHPSQILPGIVVVFAFAFVFVFTS